MGLAGTEDLARCALSTAARADALCSIGQLNASFGSQFRALGFKAFVALELESENPALGHVLCGEGHERWVMRYRTEDYLESDPIVRAIACGHTGFFWSDVCDTPFSIKTKKLFQDAHDHGFFEGFAARVCNTDDTIIVALFAGRGVQIRDPYIRVAATVLTTYYGLNGLRLHRAPVSTDTSLTSRQTECLTWVRAGKSSTDIGSILGISADVVDEHVKKACQRLGVRTRLQAVIEAEKHALISV